MTSLVRPTKIRLTLSVAGGALQVAVGVLPVVLQLVAESFLAGVEVSGVKGGDEVNTHTKMVVAHHLGNKDVKDYLVLTHRLFKTR